MGILWKHQGQMRGITYLALVCWLPYSTEKKYKVTDLFLNVINVYTFVSLSVYLIDLIMEQ